jgi:hypothetical protein
MGRVLTIKKDSWLNEFNLVPEPFRKKPVIVSAVHMYCEFYVETIEGIMHGNAGDWLVIGVDGERYPVKDSIFRKTYEAFYSVDKLEDWK